MTTPKHISLEYQGSLYQMLRRSWKCADIDPDNVELDEDFMINQTNDPENGLYFYHTDHLGSSSWITDASGAVNQHIQYLPFGEQFIYQRNSSWDVPYTFSGKEKDSETGYSYFGARYYSSDLSVWLSVDPLASRYPNESPYCYAGLNPVMITDPNGMWKDEGDGKWTAEKGDSWWSLHKQSGMTWKETMAYAKKYNAGKGRDNWKTVREGDAIDLSGGNENNIETVNIENQATARTVQTYNPTSSGNHENGESGGSVDATPYVGGALGVAGEVMFSDKFGTWMGKDGKIHNQNWGGNGRTGGKFKFAGKVGRTFKIGGWVFGAYGMYSTNAEWQNNQISTGQMIIEQVSNAIGFIPTYGTVWSIFWNLGQDYGPSTWYGENDDKWFE